MVRKIIYIERLSKYINYNEVMFYETMGCKGINAVGSIIDK